MVSSVDIAYLLKKYNNLVFEGFTSEYSLAQFNYLGHWFCFGTYDPYNENYDFVKTVSDYIDNNFLQVSIFDIIYEKK